VQTAPPINRLAELDDERFRAISDLAPVFIWTVGADRKLRFINKAWLAFTGITLEHARGDGWREVLHPDDVPAIQNLYHRTFMEHVPLQIEHRLRYYAGGFRWIYGRNIPIHALDGTLLGMIGWGVDISERKNAEANLRRANSQLEQRILERTGALTLMNKQLEVATRHKSEFLASMSHELRTPLNAIIGFAELIHDGKAGPVNDEQVEYLDDVLASANHLLRLLNGILDVARVESGKLALLPEQMDPRDAVEMVTDALRPMAEREGVTVSWRVEPLGHIVVDPQRFKQLLFNYLSNALKHTGRGGRVEIRISADGSDSFRLEVEDNGHGIEPDDLSRLFQDFEQIEPHGLHAQGGSGLGLALTRRIVEAQGGAVGARSVPGEGSVFFAVLPRDLTLAVRR
jgi:PAS domain S-box-containing protein